MKTLIVYRGLPGSGKSHHHAAHYPDATVCSADDYFVGPDGIYRFRPQELGRAHAWCQVRAVQAMANGIPCVVVDNTHVRYWEFSIYLALAEGFGYQVRYEVLFDAGLSDEELAQRNRHGVPKEAIARMRAAFEPADVFPSVRTRQQSLIPMPQPSGAGHTRCC